MSLTSLLTIGTSGLDAAGTDLQVIGNNIANANTDGFKQSRADFSNQISQSLLGSGQIGLGTQLQMAQKIMNQGSLVTTGNATDLALQGNGFFVVQGNSNGATGQFYTRNGQFSIDQKGLLVTQGALDVQGYQADVTGKLSGQMGNLLVGNASAAPNPTANVTLKANLDATAVTPLAAWNVAQASATSNFSTSTTVYDSLGTAHQAQVYFRNDGGGKWEWHAVSDGGGLTGGVAGTPTEIAAGTLTYNTVGALTAQTQASTFNPLGATNPQPLTFNFGTPTPAGTGLDGITQFASPSATTFLNQDGFASGALANISVDATGNITGSFTNGQTRLLGQVAVATFSATDKLQDNGANLYGQTFDSGQPTIGAASTGGRASISSGAIEQSNVDLSGQFVAMIAAQRDFQANARTVSAADSVLQTLMSINANNG